MLQTERQAQLYGVGQGALAIGFGELLKGRAEQWFWTFQHQRPDNTWFELRDAFIQRYSPHRETDYEIRSKIENRKQKVGESFNDYCQDVEALETRLIRRMEEGELVEVIRRNMSMSLRKSTWRERLQTVGALLQCCTDYERLLIEEERQSAYQRRYMKVHEVEWNAHPNNVQLQDVPQQSQYIEAMCSGPIRGQSYPICFNCRDIGHTCVVCPALRARETHEGTECRR